MFLNDTLHILLVEDNPGDVTLFRENLRDIPHFSFELHSEGDLGGCIAVLDGKIAPDVLVLDLGLPETKGVETLRRVVSAAGPMLPIVVLTGNDDDALAMEALHCGAQDYIVKESIAPSILYRSLQYAVERKKTENLLIENQKMLETHLAGLERVWEQTVNVLAVTAEAKDPYTAGHQKRVAQLSELIAKELGMDDHVAKQVKLAASIHDFGKIEVPSEILAKPGKLSTVEFDLIKTHPQVGYRILKEIDLPWPLAEIVYQHHESFDGTGYPQGLKGDQILIEARIIRVADTVEAMSSHRPYRPGLGLDAALEELKKNSGNMYDPVIVEVCLALFKNGFEWAE